MTNDKLFVPGILRRPASDCIDSPFSVIPSLPKHFRTWLVRACAAWLGATFVMTLAGILWGLLALLGDASGAAVARGLVLFAATLWLILLGALVLLLTWDGIAHAREGEAPAEPLVHHRSD